jgi:hypothetical protein
MHPFHFITIQAADDILRDRGMEARRVTEWPRQPRRARVRRPLRPTVGRVTRAALGMTVAAALALAAIGAA